MDYLYNYYLGGPYVGALTIAMKGGNFWLTALICVVFLMLPVLTTRFYAYDVNPNLIDKIRLKRKMQKATKSSEDVTRTPSAKRPRRSLRSGYAFAHHVSDSFLFNKRMKITLFLYSPIKMQFLGGFWSAHNIGKNNAKVTTGFCIPIGLRNQTLSTTKW